MDSFFGPHIAIFNRNGRRELWSTPGIAKSVIVVEGRFLLCVVTMIPISPSFWMFDQF
jgi:hypothetical protein